LNPNVRHPLLLVAIPLACALPAAGQTVLTAITGDDLAVTVREAGTAFGVPITAETRASTDTTSAVYAEMFFPSDSTSTPDTLRFFVGLDACEEGRCTALSAVAFFGTGENGPGTDDMNAWNATRRLTRAYVTPQGLALQSDYDLAGGVAQGAIDRFIRSYLISLATFADALRAAAEPVPTDEPAPPSPAPEE
jgi:hypothetical protein